MSSPTAWTLEEGSAQIASMVGEEHVRVRGESVVCAPADTVQIAQILRFANANGLAVTASGSGTKLVWGNPVAADIQLSMGRMNTLREHAWQDMTCTVEAGSTWAAMQAALARHGQMVALDPLWPERATVGGIVAVNDSGALRLKYGGLRDLIIGMTVLLADGTIAKTGGKVVKNVAGYDLHKLMTGSFGTLGVIAEVHFRLHPLEQHSRTWTAIAPHPSVFDVPLRSLLDSQMTASCVQLRVSQRQSALDVRIAGLPHCLDESGVRLKSILEPLEVSESSESVWQARQELVDREDGIVLKVSLIPSEVCAVLSELQKWAEGIDCAAVAQATGLMMVALQSSPEAAVALIERLRAKLRVCDGSVVALQIPEALRNKLDVWGSAAGALTLVLEIKRRFDPNRILNPGRFVGNI
jgi:glycolate dehydrogenase FAD-binding subunit